MKVPEWSKKQTILIGVLAGLLLLALIFLIAVATRPAAETLVDEPSTADSDDIELIDEGVASLQTEATPPPDLSLLFRADDANPLPEDGAVLALGGDYTIGGTIYSNYPLDSVTVTISCSHNNQNPYPY